MCNKLKGVSAHSYRAEFREYLSENFPEVYDNHYQHFQVLDDSELAARSLWAWFSEVLSKLDMIGYLYTVEEMSQKNDFAVCLVKFDVTSSPVTKFFTIVTRNYTITCVCVTPTYLKNPTK